MSDSAKDVIAAIATTPAGLQQKNAKGGRQLMLLIVKSS
jgi:hypothetical protein